MNRHKPGINEYYPQKVWKYRQLEEKLAHVLYLHNYQEVRLSILQDFQLIHSGVGALMEKDGAKATKRSIVDIDSKAKDQAPMSLRPEGTISVLHHATANLAEGQVRRIYYLGEMFRKSAEGEVLEFNQLGVEFIGSHSSVADNEVISLGMRMCKELGLGDARIRLNSYGCNRCRPDFYQAMKEHLRAHKGEFCSDCFKQLSINPFNETLCEKEHCQKVIAAGPTMLSHLCEDCQNSFNTVKKVQANLAYQYKVSPKLYKNYAYYNQTVFNFVLLNGGKEIVIGGGGRYDYLSEMITGRSIGAVGFYLDLDTLFEVMEERELIIVQNKAFSVYLSTSSDEMEMMLLQIAQELHDNNIKTVLGTSQLSVEEEAKVARKANCDLMIIIREENVREGKILMRNLIKERQDYISLHDILDAILIARKSLNSN